MIAGAVSTVLYILVSALGLGFLFLFLPTLPVFWLGFKRETDAALHACLVTTLLLTLLVHPATAMMYFLSLGMPAWYFTHEAMKSGHSPHSESPIWFPLTIIFARLMTASCFMLLFAALYHLRHEGGLPGFLGLQIAEMMKQMPAHIDPKSIQVLEQLSPTTMALGFGLSTWLWAICLYVHAWIANREAKRQKLATRPHLAIDLSPPPNWMISLLVITCVAAFAGSESLAFWGKASLVTLLFPYLLLSTRLLHKLTIKLQYQNLVLFLIYLSIAFKPMLVFLLAAYGVIYHVRLLNKYLSAGGSSFKS